MTASGALVFPGAVVGSHCSTTKGGHLRICKKADYKKYECKISNKGGIAWYSGLHHCLSLQGSPVPIQLRAF